MLYRQVLKSCFDTVASAGLLILCMPVMGAVALYIRVRLGSPVLFRQRRPGLHGKPFTLLKFRTMSDERDAHGAPLPDEQRLGTAGKLLRGLSVDELPTLLNVLRGDMSLVGPRPLLPQYLSRYSPIQARRHEVRPGITGLAQVSGRNALSWSEKLVLDVKYVDAVSLTLDARILIRTIGSVLRRDGIASPGSATAPEFMGPEP